MSLHHPLRELTLTRVREFFREPEAIFWVYVFPILLAVGLGIAFRTQSAEMVRVMIEDAAPVSSAPRPLDAEAAAAILRKDPRFRVEVKRGEGSHRELILGRADLVVTVGRELSYSYDPQRPEGRLARAWADDVLQEALGRRDPLSIKDRPSSEPGGRYIDFLIPGLIGMNIMGGGLWGVGFVIVDMRVRKLLKRFLATPMRKRDFLLSIVGSRLIFLVPEITLLLLVGWWGFGLPQRGSLAAVAAIVFLSGLCFSGMGLLVASRASKIETVSGLMNVVMLPMWLLSGIFFSSERFPDFMQPFIKSLPLTATIDSLRAVILEGRTLPSQSKEMLVLAAWGIVSFVLSLRWFRWL